MPWVLFFTNLYRAVFRTTPTHKRASSKAYKRKNQHRFRGLCGPFVFAAFQKIRNARFPNFDAFLSAITGVADQLDVAIPPKSTGITEESDALFAKVLSYRELCELDLAKQRLHEFVSRFPSDYRGWTETGVTYLAMGDAQQAYDATKKSLSLYPFNSHAWNNLGVALSRLGKSAEAVNALRTAVSHDPLNTGAMLNQSTPLVELKRPIEAVQVLERAASLAPDKAAVWANLGAVKMQFFELDEAEHCFEKALALHPGLHQVEVNLERLRQLRNTGS